MITIDIKINDTPVDKIVVVNNKSIDYSGMNQVCLYTIDHYDFCEKAVNHDSVMHDRRDGRLWLLRKVLEELTKGDSKPGAEITRPDDYCEWKYDDYYGCYDRTCCEEPFYLSNDEPLLKNNIHHCPNCGRKIKDVKP